MRTAFLRLAAAALLTLALCAPAEARTIRDTWQVTLDVPAQLWDDAASLPLMLGTKRDVFTSGATTYSILWNNFSVSAPDDATAVRRVGSGFGAPTAAVVDRRVPAARLRRLRLEQRKLWSDADVLLAAADTPICGGLTRDQLDAVLAGRITDWRTVFPGWPAGVSSRVALYFPNDDQGKPRRLFGRRTYGGGARSTTDAGTLETGGGAVGVNKLTYALRFLASTRHCAAPVGGVGPSEATIRSGSYPFAYDVWWVDEARPDGRHGSDFPAQHRRWRFHLWGKEGTKYLTTALGRRRFLP